MKKASKKVTSNKTKKTNTKFQLTKEEYEKLTRDIEFIIAKIDKNHTAISNQIQIMDKRIDNDLFSILKKLLPEEYKDILYRNMSGSIKDGQIKTIGIDYKKK